jgi:hypothetical protein
MTTFDGEYTVFLPLWSKVGSDSNFKAMATTRGPLDDV